MRCTAEYWLENAEGLLRTNPKITFVTLTTIPELEQYGGDEDKTWYSVWFMATGAPAEEFYGDAYPDLSVDPSDWSRYECSGWPQNQRDNSPAWVGRAIRQALALEWPGITFILPDGI